MAGALKISVASPCSADWNQMPGGTQVRHCSQCNLDVYNFSEMTATEVETLIAARTGRLCGRFYQRADGTMLTKNCPVGFRSALLRSARAAAAALTTLVSIAPTIARAHRPQESSNTAHTRAESQSFVLQILDPAGGAVPNAALEITSETTGKRVQAVTDADGNAHLTGLPPGVYDVVVQASGFGDEKVLHLRIPESGVT